MTPEEKEKMKEMYDQIRKLQAQVDSFYAFATIPFPVEKAFKDRFRIDQYAILEPSAKSASSENQSVNEAGVATYSVLKPPDGFEQRNVGGNTRYYAFWT